MPDTTTITLGNVIAWLLSSTRTVDELIQVSGIVKARCEDGSFAGQVRRAFDDVTAQADAEEKAKFGPP